MAESIGLGLIDIETSDLSQFDSTSETGGVVASAESGAALHGSYGMQLAFDGISGTLSNIKAISPSGNEAYFRFYLNIPSGFSWSSNGAPYIGGLYSSTLALAWIRTSEVGTDFSIFRFYYRTNAGSSNISVGQVLSRDTDYYIEVYYKAGNGDGAVEMWIDGVSVASATGLTNDLYTPDNFQITWDTALAPDNGSILYFDDMKASESYIGAYSDVSSVELYTAAPQSQAGAISLQIPALLSTLGEQDQAGVAALSIPVQLSVLSEQAQTGNIDIQSIIQLAVSGEQQQAGVIEISSAAGLRSLSEQLQAGDIQIQIPSNLAVLSEQNQDGIIEIQSPVNLSALSDQQQAGTIELLTVSGFQSVASQSQEGNISLSIPVQLSIDGQQPQEGFVDLTIPAQLLSIAQQLQAGNITIGEPGPSVSQILNDDGFRTKIIISFGSRDTDAADEGDRDKSIFSFGRLI